MSKESGQQYLSRDSTTTAAGSGNIYRASHMKNANTTMLAAGDALSTKSSSVKPLTNLDLLCNTSMQPTGGHKISTHRVGDQQQSFQGLSVRSEVRPSGGKTGNDNGPFNQRVQQTKPATDHQANHPQTNVAANTSMVSNGNFPFSQQGHTLRNPEAEASQPRISRKKQVFAPSSQPPQQPHLPTPTLNQISPAMSFALDTIAEEALISFSVMLRTSNKHVPASSPSHAGKSELAGGYELPNGPSVSSSKNKRKRHR
jgi:hypothetical protein